MQTPTQREDIRGYDLWEGGRIADLGQSGSERFRGGAPAYADYLETPEGRLRSDLAFANLREFLPAAPTERRLRALDIGSGTGAMGVRLAGLGLDVTLLDASPEMLELAYCAGRAAGLLDKLRLQEGEASEAANLFRGEFFDVIVCHNVLEFVDEPYAVLRSAAQLMRESAVLSLLVRTQAGEILKFAIQSGDLAGAGRSLTAEWGRESLFGGTVRLFTPESVTAMLRQASLEPAAVRGVRAISDYLPASISREAEYERIFELERKLGCRPEFAAVARYAQFLVRRTPQPEHRI